MVRVGNFALIVGVGIEVAVVLTQTDLGSKEAEQLFGRVGVRENPNRDEAAAVAQLFQTKLGTRAAFLTRALGFDPDRLRVNEQGLSILYRG